MSPQPAGIPTDLGGRAVAVFCKSKEVPSDVLKCLPFPADRSGTESDARRITGPCTNMLNIDDVGSDEVAHLLLAAAEPGTLDPISEDLLTGVDLA